MIFIRNIKNILIKQKYTIFFLEKDKKVLLINIPLKTGFSLHNNINGTTNVYVVSNLFESMIIDITTVEFDENQYNISD